METVTEQRYENQDVIADDIAYVRCVFFKCRIIYSGSGSFNFKKCTFDGCTFAFADAARNTLAFLSFMHSFEPATLKEINNMIQSHSLLDLDDGEA